MPDSNGNNPNKAGILKFVPGHTLTPVNRTYHGLDLGHRHDHSALAEIEVQWNLLGRCATTWANLYQPEVELKRILRFPLGTPYDHVIEMVTSQLSRSASNKDILSVDAGGPGVPVVERLRQTLFGKAIVRPVLITGGRGQNTQTDGYTGVPRRTLISNLLIAISANTLYAQPGVENWKLFIEEMAELRGDTTHPSGSRHHDDTVMAVALALYAALQDTKQLLPDDGNPTGTIGPVNRRLL